LRVLAFGFAILILARAGSADAATVNIVALGASNTAGKGVARQNAYPAQLEALLRARGIDARVVNAGINGDTTGGMLRRLNSAVPSGTDIVILQPGGNDARKGVGAARAANVDTLVHQLQARNIKVIMLQKVLAVPAHMIQPDHQHLTPEGYGVIAARLLPQVLSALGR
jgi:acyl-CoA thioesterase-1